MTRSERGAARAAQARPISVAGRTRNLFGKDQAHRALTRRAKWVKQITLFEELEAAEKDAGWRDTSGFPWLARPRSIVSTEPWSCLPPAGARR